MGPPPMRRFHNRTAWGCAWDGTETELTAFVTWYAPHTCLYVDFAPRDRLLAHLQWMGWIKPKDCITTPSQPYTERKSEGSPRAW